MSALRGRSWPAIALAAAGSLAQAQPFHLPTANRALFEPDGEERFFVGTVGKPWTSGTFGCVRSDGGQMHEGLDIKCVQRDGRGEPSDEVMATADGTVAYINSRPSLSNYGNYVVLRHEVEGIEIHSVYAHLRQVREGLKAGEAVKAGEVIAIMGRSTNTREGISKERAHVHFELALLMNERFPGWYQKSFPDQRNDHGQWNGQNLFALDARLLLIESHRRGHNFSLPEFILNQTELCRVLVRETDFSWLRRYPRLMERIPVTVREEAAGYEISLNFNGVPFRLVPRASAEIKGPNRIQLLSVNEPEYNSNPCRRLVVKRGGRWELGYAGRNLVELLTF